MEGMQELSERIFEMPVKLGIPTGFGCLTEAARSPIHATGVGLCKYAVETAEKKNVFCHSYDYVIGRGPV